MKMTLLEKEIAIAVTTQSLVVLERTVICLET